MPPHSVLHPLHSSNNNGSSTSSFSSSSSSLPSSSTRTSSLSFPSFPAPWLTSSSFFSSSSSLPSSLHRNEADVSSKLSERSFEGCGSLLPPSPLLLHLQLSLLYAVQCRRILLLVGGAEGGSGGGRCLVYLPWLFLEAGWARARGVDASLASTFFSSTSSSSSFSSCPVCSSVREDEEQRRKERNGEEVEQMARHERDEYGELRAETEKDEEEEKKKNRRGSEGRISERKFWSDEERSRRRATQKDHGGEEEERRRGRHFGLSFSGSSHGSKYEEEQDPRRGQCKEDSFPDKTSLKERSDHSITPLQKAKEIARDIERRLGYLPPDLSSSSSQSSSSLSSTVEERSKSLKNALRASSLFARKHPPSSFNPPPPSSSSLKPPGPSSSSSPPPPPSLPSPSSSSLLPRVYRSIPQKMLVVLQRRQTALCAAKEVAAARRSPLGDEVGVAVRLNFHVNLQKTALLFTTFSLFLRHFLRDPLLLECSVLFVEVQRYRSSFVDLTLSLLRKVLSKNVFLRVVFLLPDEEGRGGDEEEALRDKMQKGRGKRESFAELIRKGFLIAGEEEEMNEKRREEDEEEAGVRGGRRRKGEADTRKDEEEAGAEEGSHVTGESARKERFIFSGIASREEKEERELMNNHHTSSSSSSPPFDSPVGAYSSSSFFLRSKEARRHPPYSSSATTTTTACVPLLQSSPQEEEKKKKEREKERPSSSSLPSSLCSQQPRLRRWDIRADGSCAYNTDELAHLHALAYGRTTQVAFRPSKESSSSQIRRAEEGDERKKREEEEEEREEKEEGKIEEREDISFVKESKKSDGHRRAIHTPDMKTERVEDIKRREEEKSSRDTQKREKVTERFHAEGEEKQTKKEEEEKHVVEEENEEERERKKKEDERGIDGEECVLPLPSLIPRKRESPIVVCLSDTSSLSSSSSSSVEEESSESPLSSPSDVSEKEEDEEDKRRRDSQERKRRGESSLSAFSFSGERKKKKRSDSNDEKEKKKKRKKDKKKKKEKKKKKKKKKMKVKKEENEEEKAHDVHLFPPHVEAEEYKKHLSFSSPQEKEGRKDLSYVSLLSSSEEEEEKLLANPRRKDRISSSSSSVVQGCASREGEDKEDDESFLLDSSSVSSFQTSQKGASLLPLFPSISPSSSSSSSSSVHPSITSRRAFPLVPPPLLSSSSSSPSYSPRQGRRGENEEKDRRKTPSLSPPSDSLRDSLLQPLPMVRERSLREAIHQAALLQYGGGEEEETKMRRGSRKGKKTTARRRAVKMQRRKIEAFEKTLRESTGKCSVILSSSWRNRSLVVRDREEGEEEMHEDEEIVERERQAVRRVLIEQEERGKEEEKTGRGGVDGDEEEEEGYEERRRRRDLERRERGEEEEREKRRRDVLDFPILSFESAGVHEASPPSSLPDSHEDDEEEREGQPQTINQTKTKEKEDENITERHEREDERERTVKKRRIPAPPLPPPIRSPQQDTALLSSSSCPTSLSSFSSTSLSPTSPPAFCPSKENLSLSQLEQSRESRSEVDESRAIAEKEKKRKKKKRESSGGSSLATKSVFFSSSSSSSFSCCHKRRWFSPLILSVEEPLYPVSISYLRFSSSSSLVNTVVQAVLSLHMSEREVCSSYSLPVGDVLVFLPSREDVLSVQAQLQVAAEALLEAAHDKQFPWYQQDKEKEEEEEKRKKKKKHFHISSAFSSLPGMDIICLSPDSPSIPVLPSSLNSSSSSSLSRRVFLTCSLYPPPLPSYPSDFDYLKRMALNEDLEESCFPHINSVIDCMYTRRMVAHPIHAGGVLEVPLDVPLDLSTSFLRATAAGHFSPGGLCLRLLREDWLSPKDQEEMRSRRKEGNRSLKKKDLGEREEEAKILKCKDIARTRKDREGDGSASGITRSDDEGEEMNDVEVHEKNKTTHVRLREDDDDDNDEEEEDGRRGEKEATEKGEKSRKDREKTREREDEERGVEKEEEEAWNRVYPAEPTPDLLLHSLVFLLLFILTIGLSSLSSISFLTPPLPQSVRASVKYLHALEAIEWSEENEEEDEEEQREREGEEETDDKEREERRGEKEIRRNEGEEEINEVNQEKEEKKKRKKMKRKRGMSGGVKQGRWALRRPLGYMMGEITAKPEIVRLLFLSSKEPYSCSMECSILAALLSLPSPFLSPSQVVSMINLHPPHPSRYSSLHEQEEEKGGGDVFRDIDELSDDHPSFLSSSSSSLDLRRKARQRLNLVKQVLGVVGGDVLMRYNVYQQWSIYRREEEEEGEKKKKSEVWCQRHLVNESILRKVDPLISYIRGCMHKFQLPLVSCSGDSLAVQKALCGAFFLNCAYRERSETPDGDTSSSSSSPSYSLLHHTALFSNSRRNASWRGRGSSRQDTSSSWRSREEEESGSVTGEEEIRFLIDSSFSSSSSSFSSSSSLPRLFLHPSSVLVHSPPEWIVFTHASFKGPGEFYLHDITAIDPEWLPEAVAGRVHRRRR